MKKWYIFGATLALVFTAGSVFAIGLGTVKKAVKEVGHEVAAQDLQKKLDEKTAGCQCNTKTGTISGCNLDEIEGVINNYKKAVKLAIGKSFRIKPEVNQTCWTHVHSKISADSSYWSWYAAKYVSNDKLKLHVIKD